ncbi:WGR domain-containing protein [Polaribacter sp. R77954]|uniref:WGR domain-containing protein n=1 Tax=Polaribacter sp. R77954 TaxID=3093870 RepID=UPI0037CA9D89
MKLVKQKTLYFSEGKSDKVYEVDICENQDLFLVNFRYGRRGANLREGTKTVFPVAYEEALKIFNKLVESKEKKGYSENLEIEKKTTPKVHINTVREKTILKYLEQAVKNTYTRNWKVSRIILRAGNLKMMQASGLIAEFIDSKEQFEQYNAITVLASFGITEYKNKILEVFKESKFSTIGGRAACAYLLQFGDDSDKKVIQKEVSIFINDDKIKLLPIKFLNAKASDVLLLYYAYIFSFEDEDLRSKIYKLIERLPFKANTFKSIRYIFRTTQITEDVQFFTLLSKRFALNKSGFNSNYFYDEKGNWITAEKELKKPNPSIAFSNKTKSYFNHTIYKKMYDLSQDDVENYIKYATQMLIGLNDKEDDVKEEIQHNYDYDWEAQTYNNEQRCFPKYANYPALMYVLYGASTRFVQQKNQWYYVVTDTAVNQREEVLANIWNQKPDEVIQILANTKSDVAVNFSLKIIDENSQFLEDLSSETILKLVNHYHPKVISLIVEVLKTKYTDTEPEENIVIGLLNSGNEKALELAFYWLVKYGSTYFSSKKFVISLLLTNQIEVISFLSQLYKDEIIYNHKIDIQEIAVLFKKKTHFTREFLIAVANLIGNTKFGELLNGTSANKITKISNSTLVTNKLFAINLAKHNSTPAYQIFKDSFDEYINADDELLRKAGIEILSHFPDQFLLENKEEIVGFCFSEYKEVREAIQPTIDRLVKLDAKFKQSLLNKLLFVLTEAETYEGLHENSYQLLTVSFKDSLTTLSEEQIFSFVLSKYEFAQNLGTPLFEKRVNLATIPVTKLVKLANSAVFSIREKVKQYFYKNDIKINYELQEALFIFNAEWQDVIDWALVYFDEKIQPEKWTSDVLLYLCDNVKPEVQAFGMKMITKHFSNEKGQYLLEKLQEHPTKAIQFFVTNYLNGFAKDNPKVILQLEAYFKTSLFNINANRATKTRIYTFLEQESVKNEAVAKMTINIISSILDTKTIIDRSKNIDILLEIASNFPDLEIPLSIKTTADEV